MIELGKLTVASIPAIEQAAGVGIGELTKRVFGGTFKHSDLLAVLNVALVASGKAPAGELAEVFVNSMTLSEAHALATRVLEAIWFGPAVQSAAQEGDSDAN